MTLHQPGPERLDIGPSLYDSTLACARSAQHQSRSVTTARARSTRHRPGLARIDISSGLLESTPTRARSTQYWPCPAQLEIDLDLDDSTSARARTLDNDWAGPERLNIGSGLLCSTSTRIVLAQLGSGQVKTQPKMQFG